MLPGPGCGGQDGRGDEADRHLDQEHVQSDIGLTASWLQHFLFDECDCFAPNVKMSFQNLMMKSLMPTSQRS